MPNALSSWNGQLPTDVLLDSGVLYIGSSPGSAYAAQEGGLKWDPGKTIREIEFDGRRSAVAGLDRTVMWKPTLKATILEVPIAAWSQLEPGAAVTTLATGGPSGATQVAAKVAGTLYAAGDYITNARAVWQRGDGTFFQIRMPKALVVKWDLAGTDKQESKWNIEIEARLDMTVSGQLINNPPFVGEYWPSATP